MSEQAAPPQSAPAASQAPTTQQAPQQQQPANQAAAQAPVAAPPASFEAPATPPPAPAAAEPPAHGDQPKQSKSDASFPKTGDTGLDMCLDFLGKRGIGPDNPALQAAIKGDFSFLEAELAGLGDKAAGWQQYLDLGKAAYAREQTAAQERIQAIDKAVYDTVGGEQEWTAIHDWVSKNADPDEIATINQIMDLGPSAAKLIATALSTMYAGASGTVQTPASAAPNARQSAVATEGLSAREFSDEVRQLHARNRGKDIESLPDYQRLVTRRELGRRQGK